MSTNYSFGLSAGVTASPTYQRHQSATEPWINSEEWGYGVGFNSELRFEIDSLGIGLDVGLESLEFSDIPAPDIPDRPDNADLRSPEWTEYREALYQADLQYSQYLARNMPRTMTRFGISARYALSLDDSLNGVIRFSTGWASGTDQGDGFYGSLLFGIANRIVDMLGRDEKTYYVDYGVNFGPSVSYFPENDILMAGLTLSAGLDIGGVTL